MTSIRTRFAPSPTGYMHVGNLRTALYTWLLARSQGGRFILRIEDTDQEREVPGAVEKIYRALRTAGLDHDEGPDLGGPCGPYIQSQRRDIYLQYAQRLVDMGGAYYCFCTKERLDEARRAAEAEGSAFKYDKHCLTLSKQEVQARIDAGESWVIRQNIPANGQVSFEDLIYGTITVDCDTLDDNVLLKSDGLPTYNFANVVDDHLMGITHVMRGTEYLSSAPKYNLLYQAFGWEPPKYIHVTPVMRDAKHKLSKRDGDATFEDLLAKGYLAEAIINYMALLGWSPGNDREFFTLPELVEAFSVKGLSKSPAIFDIDKLTWFNAAYIRQLSPEAFHALALPYYEQALPDVQTDWAFLSGLLHTRVEVMNQVPDFLDFLRPMGEVAPALYTHKKMKCNPEVAKVALAAALPALEAVGQWTEPALHGALMALPALLGMKNGQVLWPVRIAITGLASTPGGATEMAYLLGREETLARLGRSLAAL
ncbi:MAG: glutamate--tRNA ligase [Christensenellales bacterium]|jgi:glutamyl-tRNA synthetase